MVDDLGDYDIQPVDGNPFGSMASSPNDYDVSPVDHDPFSSAPPTIAGHVAASPDPSQPMTAKYIAARSQESANPYTPPLFDRAGNYVSETAQRYGVPTQGAERMGSATSTGLEAASYAPIVGAPLTAAEGVDAYSRGDTAGAAASGFGTLASFFGPWAKTADLGAMKMAQKMARKGAPAEDIIGKTGWFQGPEGLWRFERPDEGATFTGQGNFSRNLTLGDVYQNPEQYAAYPNLAKSPVEMLDPEYADRMGMLGGFAPTKFPRVGAPGKFLFRHDMPTDSTVPIHETTHAIQDIEGFAPGGSNLNPMQVLSTKSAQPFFNKRLDRSLEPMGYNDYLRDSVNAARAGQKGVPIASRDDVAEMEHFKGLVRAGQEQIPGGAAEEAAWQAGTDWYTHQAGEAEARNAAFRAGNPLIAKAFHPWETSDVPWDELMLPPYRGSGGRVGFDDGGGAGGGPVQLNADLRRRLAMITQPRHGLADGGDPDAAGFAALDKMVQDDRATQPPDQPAAPTPAAPQTWYGRWGQTLGDELSSVGPAVSAATEGLGKFGASVAANPVGYGPLSFRTMSPESEASLGRDFTGMLDSPMLGEVAGMPRAPEAAATRVGATGSDVSAGASASRALIMDINGVKRHIDPEFPESRVGTAVPWKEDANAPIDAEQAAHANNDAHVGMELADTVPSYGKSVANMVRNGRIPYVKVAPGASDAAVQEALIEHMKDNLLGLYSRVSGAVRSGSKLWYEGANSRSQGIAQTHDIPHENAAGVVAAMSPQKDWDQNVALADWVAHTAGTTDPSATMSPAMTDWVNKYALRKDSERVVTDPTTGKETRFNARTGEQMAPNSVSREDVQRQLAEVNGVPWGQMDPDQKAFYTRAYYEAHGPPDHLIATDDQTGAQSHWIDEKGDRKYGYYINNPDGTHDGVLARYGDEFPNKKGQPIPVSWGSTGEVSNAIKAFGANSMSDISEALGGGHKVRSFFNNIIAPWSRKGDVTSDTHAVAAALLRPLGAGSPEAASGMGAASPGNAETGLNGFYPHVAEAYRRAARDAGVLPRELQSITWEALRGLWSAREKSAKSNVRTGFTSQTDITNGIWQRYHNNQMTMEDAHNAILGPQGERIDPPRWFNTFRP